MRARMSKAMPFATWKAALRAALLLILIESFAKLSATFAASSSPLRLSGEGVRYALRFAPVYWTCV